MKCRCCGEEIDSTGISIYLYQPYKLKFYCSDWSGPTRTIIQKEIILSEQYLDDDLWGILITQLRIKYSGDPHFRFCFMEPERWRAHFLELHRLGHKPRMRSQE